MIGAIPGIEIYIAVPLGVIMGLSPLMAAILAVSGNILTVAAMALTFPHFKGWVFRKFLLNHTVEAKEESINQYQFFPWNKYGISIRVSVEMDGERRQRLFYLWNMKKNVAEAIDGFIGAQIQAGKSPLTAKTYRQAIITFSRYL